MLTATSFAADSLQTTVSKATVFLSGAQVFRESKSFSVKKGVHEVVITDVSPYLNQNQIQATAKGNFLILDIQYQTEYIPPSGAVPAIVPQKIQKEIDWLNDTILFIGFEKERISEKLKNLNEEKRMDESVLSRSTRACLSTPAKWSPKRPRRTHFMAK